MGLLMKKFFSLIGLMFFCLPLVAFADVTASFLLEKNSGETYEALLQLHNTSDQPINHWTLWLNTARPITHAENAEVIHEQGDFFGIRGIGSNTIISPQSYIVIKITGHGQIKNISDAPAGYFLVEQGTEAVVDVVSKTLISYEKPPKLSHRSEPVVTDSLLGNSLIIPLPVEVQRNKGEFIINSATKIVVQSEDPAIRAVADFFATSLQPAMGYRLSMSPGTEKTNSIVFTDRDVNSDLGREGYLLDVSPEKILIRAKAAEGMFYAVQSVRQLLPPAIFSRYSQHNTVWKIPTLHLKDYPRFSYRGLHLDVARHFFNVDQIKRLLDLMALHKLNVFHWHLTDDEGWRIQIRHYPALTQVGAWRGFKETLQPAFGSGYGRYGGYYTQTEIREIVRYAEERHITIIPEIDIPGHARAMIKSLPELLIDPHDDSRYTSVQGYHDNVLSPCLESTYQVLNNIFAEVAELFPGSYIHVGADEVPHGVWEKAPRCATLLKQQHLENAMQLQHYFLQRVQEILTKQNRSMAGWEEIIKSDGLPHDALVYAWTSSQPGITAAEKGYSVVMMPAPYLYFDLAYNDSPYEPGYYWAGYVDTFKAYSYQPITAELSTSVTARIKGVEGALWTENIDSQDRLDYMAFPKVAALAELAWTQQDRRNWQDFFERMYYFHLPRLDVYGVKYRISKW